MRRLAWIAAALALACHRTPGTDWPESERAKLVAGCRTAPAADAALCECLYRPENLPATVAWHEYDDWRAADSARKDPGITHAIAEINARCASEHATPK